MPVRVFGVVTPAPVAPLVPRLGFLAGVALSSLLVGGCAKSEASADQAGAVTVASAEALDCSQFRAHGDHCFQMPADGFFLLPVDRGSYAGLPAWYGVFALAWCALAAFWWRRTRSRAARPQRAPGAAARAGRLPAATKLQSSAILVPALKLGIMVVSAAFWAMSA